MSMSPCRYITWTHKPLWGRWVQRGPQVVLRGTKCHPGPGSHCLREPCTLFLHCSPRWFLDSRRDIKNNFSNRYDLQREHPHHNHHCHHHRHHDYHHHHHHLYRRHPCPLFVLVLIIITASYHCYNQKRWKSKTTQATVTLVPLSPHWFKKCSVQHFVTN